MMTNKFNQSQMWRLGASLLCLVLVVAACTKEEIDDTEVANIIARQMEGDLLSAADAKDIEGMTLTSVDTIMVFDQDTYAETVTVVQHYEDAATNRTKSIRRVLRGQALANYDMPPPPPPRPPSPRQTEMFRNQTVYKIVEEMPRFPGCETKGLLEKELQQCATKEMLAFIYSNIKYPISARDAGVEGTGVVSFIVGTDGELLEPKVVRNPAGDEVGPIADDFEKELLKVTSGMPEWTPGKQQGKDVQVRFYLPVKFKLA